MRRGTSLAKIPVLAFAGALLCLGAARADELKLKDGSKIVGSIVGFEENSFKVKTSYGYAVVQRDQVVAINISDTGAKPEAEKKAEPAVEKPAAPAKPVKVETAAAAAAAPAPTPPAATATTKAPTVAVAAENGKSAAAPSVPTKSGKGESATASAPPASVAAVSKPAPVGTTTSASAAAPAPATPDTPKSSPPAAATSAAKATPPAAAATAPPAKPAGPQPVREEVSGNLYTNDTYGFRMYKPPGWDVIEGARTILPGALTAMGTSDQRTYLLVGLSPAGETLTDDIEDAEQRLREVMASFRVTEQKRMMVSGVSSIAHRFRGSVDQHEWSGVVVFVPLGPHIYTIFGMTYAESDLVQIQENVINRTISSLQFLRN
jgi:hypothetical protein